MNTFFTNIKKYLAITLAMAMVLSSFLISPKQTTHTANAAQACETPITVGFPFAIQADDGNVLSTSGSVLAKGIALNSNIDVFGDINSNADVKSVGLLNKVFGNISAVGTVDDSFTKIIIQNNNPPFVVNENNQANAKNLPLFDPVIWQNAAAAGGTINQTQSYGVGSVGNKLGPVIINGDLILEESSEVILTGTVYVTGNIIVAKNAKLNLDGTTFGSSGTVLMSAGKIDLDGNSSVNRTTNTGYLLLVSSNSNSFDSINIQKNFGTGSGGLPNALFYSLKGGVIVGENSNIIAVAGDAVRVDSNANINFVPGLAFATFFCPPPVGTPSLSITKSSSTAQVTSGNSFAYTITVSNSGSAAATNVVVSDTLNSNLTFVSSNPVPTTTTPLTWNLGTINAGQNKTITLTVSAKSGILSTTTVSNTATLVADGVGQTTSNTTTTTINPAPVQQAVISLSKTTNQTTVPQGGTFTYTITATNTGNIPANSVVISDALDPNITLVSATPQQNSTSVAEGITTLTWQAGIIQPNASYIINLTVRVNAEAPAETTINNTVTSTSTNADPQTASSPGVSVVTFTPTGSANIALQKTATPANPAVGDQVTFTLTATNGGPDKATNLVINDVLPAGLTFVSSNPSQGSYNNSNGIWTVGTLENGSTATLELVATINQAGAGTTITNTAIVASVDQTNDLSGDTASASVSVAGVNNGGGGQTGILTVVSVVVNDNGGNKGAGDFPLFVDGNSVTSGTPNTLQTGSYTVTFTTQSGYQTTFSGDCSEDGTVTISSGDNKTCTVTSNDIAGQVTPADPAVTKTVSGQPVEGSSIVYTVTVTNNGGIVANDVIVLDALPTQVTFVSSNPSQGTYNAGTGIWDVGTLAPGVTATLTINATINTGIGQSTIVNTAIISNSPGDGDTSNNTAQAILNVSGTGGEGGTGNASINVIVSVVNDSGGTKTPADFTVNVTGSNVTPASFPGSSTGTLVSIDNGSYSVDITDASLINYVKILPANCTGTINQGQSLTCTITLDDPASGGGGGGSSGGSSGGSGGGGGGGSTTSSGGPTSAAPPTTGSSGGGGGGSSSGGSSGGSGGSSGAPSGEVAGANSGPQGQIGDSASTTAPVPNVQGAVTTLPRTGLPISFLSLLLIPVAVILRRR